MTKKIKSPLDKINIPVVQEIVEPTYGVLLYQEQVIMVARKVAGFTEEKADILRRAMGKKKPEVMESLKKDFIAGTIANGYSKVHANKLFTIIEAYADYAFNAAHAISYARISQIMAYLKAHYPAHFIVGTINSKAEGSSDKKEETLQRMLDDAKELNIPVVFPILNESSYLARVDKIDNQDTVVLGWNTFKGLGKKFADKLDNEQKRNGPFDNLDDLCMRMWRKTLQSKTIEVLVDGGALDHFDNTRQYKILKIQTLAKEVKKVKVRKDPIFTYFQDGSVIDSTLIPKEEFSTEKLFHREKEAFGFSLRGNILDQLTEFLPTVTLEPFSNFPKDDIGTIAVIINDIKIWNLKASGKEMAKLLVEDYDCTAITILLYSNQWQKFQQQLQTKSFSQIKEQIIGKVALIKGTRRGDEAISLIEYLPINLTGVAYDSPE